MRKFVSLCCAAMLLCSGLSACGENNQAEVVTEDEMPYGATVIVDKNYAVPMQYDNRFLNDPALLKTISSYYHAIQDADAAEFSSLLFPLYHEFELTSLYNNEFTDQDILDNTRAAIQDYYGGEFAYSLIDVTDLISEDNLSPNRDALKNMLDDLASDMGKEKVSEGLSAMLELKITRYLAGKDTGYIGETNTVMADEYLYALQYKGQWYLIYS
ncbi:MAG: hypothetical protein MJ071_05450 [Oscillospiraceae bacterium]|nr:hypothetical protein [Oscillospiraceae bacterium]